MLIFLRPLFLHSHFDDCPRNGYQRLLLDRCFDILLQAASHMLHEILLLLLYQEKSVWMPSADKQILQGATVPLHCEFSMNYFTVYLTGGSSFRCSDILQKLPVRDAAGQRRLKAVSVQPSAGPANPRARRPAVHNRLSFPGIPAGRFPRLSSLDTVTACSG